MSVISMKKDSKDLFIFYNIIDKERIIKHTLKKTFSTKGGSKNFTSGTQEICDSVVNASYTKYEKQEIPPLEMKVAEMHSMIMVMYKQIAKLEQNSSNNTIRQKRRHAFHTVISLLPGH